MSHFDEIYKVLNETVQDEWKEVPPPNSEKWNLTFQETCNDLLHNGGNGFAPQVRKKAKASRSKKAARAPQLDESQAFKIAHGLMNTMEGLWLQGKIMLKSIKHCQTSRPLNVNELVQYATRIRGTSYSPPENSNVIDTSWHYQLFPQYHFLGIPNVDQMHKSRLFALDKLQEQTCAPQVVFETISQDMKKMIITCSTKDSTIHYQTARVNPNQRDPTTGQPVQAITAPAIYDPNKKFHFKTNCQPFTVYTWATSKHLRQSGVVQVTYNPPNTSKNASLARQTFSSLLLGRQVAPET